MFSRILHQSEDIMLQKRIVLSIRYGGYLIRISTVIVTSDLAEHCPRYLNV
jgi:hypothetical protein